MLDIVSKKANTAKKSISLPPATSSRSLSWVSRYEPSSLSEVPVHNSKVKSTKEWLKKALIANSEGGPVNVLAMCGNSGSCKSTTMELICKEMQVEVVVWNEGMIDGAVSSHNNWSERQFSSSINDNGRDLFKLGDSGSRYSRKEDVLDDFALHSRYDSLGLVPKQLTHQGSSNKHQRIEMILERSRSVNNKSGQNGNKIVLIHDPPQVSPFGNSSSGGSSSSSSSSGGFKHKSAEAEALYSFLLRMGCPVVLIVSDVSGRDEFHYAAERCLPTSIRDSVCFESTYFPAITELKIVKILEKIAKAEGLLSRVTRTQLEALALSSGGDLRHSILQLQLLVEASPRPVPSIDSAVAAKSTAVSSNVTAASAEGGVIDLTLDSDQDDEVTTTAPTAGAASSGHARKRRKQNSDHILHLVDHASSSRHGVTAALDAVDDEDHRGGHQAPSDYTRRDLSFSGMHSAAKLLSAKLDDNGRLDFDPDDVNDRSDLGTDLMLSFLQGNCIDNFMEKCRCLYSIKPSSINNSSGSSSSGTAMSALYSSPAAAAAGGGMMSDEELPPDAEMYLSNTVGDMMMMTPPGAYDNAALGIAAGEDTAVVSTESVDMTCLEQLERALDSYSDVDLLLSRKYDPGSNNIDRDSGIFPDAYVAAIQSRAAAVSRGRGFLSLYEQARSSGRYKAAFLGLKRPKILNMRTAVLGMRQRLSDIREALVGMHQYSNTVTEEGEEVQSFPLHSLSLGSDLILCTVPLYRAIKAAHRERNPYQTLKPIFNEWIDWKIDTLQQQQQQQQQQHSSSDKTVTREGSSDGGGGGGGHMQGLEIDFSKGATIEDDIVDDD